MNNLKIYEDMFLSSFLFAEHLELKEWKELSKIAYKIDLELFVYKSSNYYLFRLIKSLMAKYNNILPTSQIILSYIENLDNKNLQNILLSAFVEVSETTPLPQKVLEMYLSDFETKYLLNKRNLI